MVGSTAGALNLLAGEGEVEGIDASCLTRDGMGETTRKSISPWSALEGRGGGEDTWANKVESKAV